jgi:hypothetical protein
VLIASKEKLLGKNITLKTDVSFVGYSTDSESSLYHTALIPNQHCRIHRRFQISVWEESHHDNNIYFLTLALGAPSL